MAKKETIESIKKEAYKELFNFVNWLAKKHGAQWKEIMKEYETENNKTLPNN